VPAEVVESSNDAAQWVTFDEACDLASFGQCQQFNQFELAGAERRTDAGTLWQPLRTEVD
jgi:hypothetical protein